MADEIGGHDLASIIAGSIWLADLGRRKRDRLTALEVEALGRARSDLQLDLRRLQKALKAVAGTEASEIEQCVTRLLCNVSLISYLLPIPTPNVRKALKIERGKIASDGRKKSRRTIAINKAFENARPKNWDDPWSAAGNMIIKMKAELGRQKPKIKCIGQRAIYDRLVALQKD